jgi:hypothetical protein
VDENSDDEAEDYDGDKEECDVREDHGALPRVSLFLI